MTATQFSLSKYVKHSKLSAALNAFDAATVQPGDADEDYFKDYTEAELEWANSFECEQLAGEIDNES